MSTPSVQLPPKLPGAPPPSTTASPPDHQRDRLIHRAKLLSWLSLAYMTLEGAVAITAATLAGSVALLDFGLDSAIEALASIIVIWRFTGRRHLSAQAEQRAQQLVAISFFLLAPYIAQDALRTLIAGAHPTTSWLGIGLSTASILMPPLGRAKQRIGLQLGSARPPAERAPKHALRLPRRRSPHEPRGQRRLRILVGRPSGLARDRRPRSPRRSPNLAR